MCAKAQHIARSMPKCHRLASSSETKPCSIWRTCKEYTYIVGLSVCLHYGNIIWLPWQRPLTSWKIRFIICTQPALIWCKNCENRSIRSGDNRPYTPVYWPCRTRRSQISCVNSGVTGPNFTKFSHDIQASFALLVLTLRKRYPNPFLNARATKVVSLPFFTKSVAMVTSLETSKK